VKSRTYVLAFVVLLLIYVGLTFGLPIDPATLTQYNITEAKLRVVNVSFVIPLILIFLTALYGFINLRKYAQAIAETKEGKAFYYLSLGLMLMTFSLPINSIVGQIAQYISSNHPDLLPTTTIIRNYTTLIFSLMTFLLVLIGSTALVKTLVRKGIPTVSTSLTIGLISLSAIYAWLITSRPLNQGIEEKAYFLPSWLLVLTIVIPYLIAWRAGLITTYYLYSFHKNVKGVIYKSAFKDLARGIGTVVLVSILIQLITTSSAQLSRLKLTPILLIIYLLLLLYAVGFGMVARGSKKLKKLEEI
jgi:hypothetical protein